MKLSSLAKYAWFVLFYNLLVIVWGAFVRATGSGAGCGAHWPTCQGEIIPLNGQLNTMIEYTHRLMSGLTLAFAVALVIWAWRKSNRGDVLRVGAALVLIFTLLEAVVGAGLVLLQLVGDNSSALRAAVIAIHLTNTLLLLASATLTAWWASGGERIHFQGASPYNWLLGGGLLFVILVSATGAVTALGDTLFPAGSLIEGFYQDLSPTASFLLHLRIYHPAVAAFTGIYLLFVAGWIRLQHPDREIRGRANLLMALFLVQMALGASNVLLLAPIWLQMTHLFVADLVWISLVLLTATCLRERRPSLRLVESPAR